MWSKIGGPATRIFLGGVGLYATSPATGDIYRYEGSPMKWTKIGGSGSTFAVNDVALYGLSPDGQSVWQYTGQGEQWTHIGGPAKLLIAGGKACYATNPVTGDIYRYEGSPMKWTKIGGSGSAFAVNDVALYGLSPDGNSVWQYAGQGEQWTHISSSPLEEENIAQIFAQGDKLYAASLKGEEFKYSAIWEYGTFPYVGQPFYGVRPVLGTRKLLTILWDPHRPEHPAPKKEDIEKLLFGPTPSVQDYFLKNSGGRFTIENAGILGWYDAPPDKQGDHYWDNPDPRSPDPIKKDPQYHHKKYQDGWLSGHAEKWADAIRRAAQDFDFKQYDQNANTDLSPDELAVLIVIPQNKPYGTQRPVVEKQFPKWEPLIVDDVKIKVMVEAYIGQPPSLGLVVHELAHILLQTGDMYFSFFQPYAAGPYSLMDQSPHNPPHLDPLHKLKLGWLKYRIVTASGLYRIHNVETAHEALILHDPNRDEKEYFIIENRWNGGAYDKNIPYSGLAVWHIIEDQKVFNNLPVPPKVKPQDWNDPKWKGWARRGIRMIRPIYGPPINWRLWDGADPATGYDLLSIDPNPQHQTLCWADGTPSGFALRSISTAGPEMSLKIEFP